MAKQRLLDNRHRTAVNRPMGKNRIIVLLVTLALAFYHLAEAQQPKVYNIGVLGPERLASRIQVKVFAPLLHRFLHRFHLELAGQKDKPRRRP
jgi:hypothetical protein